MQSTSSYAHMKLSVYFNVKCMAFIAHMIGPGKLALSAKTVSLMDVLQLHFFSHTQIKVAIDDQVCFSRWIDYWISIRFCHVRLLIVSHLFQKTKVSLVVHITGQWVEDGEGW